MGRWSQQRRRGGARGIGQLAPPNASGWTATVVDTQNFSCVLTQGFPAGVGHWSVRFRYVADPTWYEQGNFTTTINVGPLPALSDLYIQAAYMDNNFNAVSPWSDQKHITLHA